MSLDYPYTPFPFSITAISPAFYLYPITTNTSLGWAPSCATPECIPTASWSTGAINSTLSFQYWGVGVAFDGNIQGNMSVQLVWDGMQIPWSPSEDTLLNLPGGPTDQFFQHNITLRVADASPGARLTVTGARVNGSSYGDSYWSSDRWTVTSDDDRLDYTGFVQQTNVAQAESSTTFVSSEAGDKVSMQFNGQLVIFGVRSMWS
ncbi:hypothetical protein B0J17DRAFT_772915 [Rhizoctonia solani]|nr:hypothetical protein B0J17DRAFT_772915 [Rhizoctonia solani]